MLPEKIKVRNFMCYRNDVPTLEFDGIHVACLSGENGAGKSALLDAITWALWGKARVASDDELISLGEQEMEVDLQFGVGTGRYRVLRRRSSAKRGQTVLEMQTATSSGWRSLSGNSVRETQSLITDVLRMEYDTFINSAFLVQGKADEFTRKAPADRKRVLAEILGLNEYEQLEQRAKEQVKELTERVQGLEGLITNLREWVNKRDFFISEEASARARVEELNENVEHATLRLEGALERRRSLEARRGERDREQARLNELSRSLTETRADHNALTREVETARMIVARQAEIEGGEAELSAARTELSRLDGLREQALVIRDERRDLEERISEARRPLQTHHDRLLDEIDRAEKLIAQRPAIQAEQTTVLDQLAMFAAAAAELEQARTMRDELEEQGRVLAQLLIEAQRLHGSIAVHKDSLIAARENENRRIVEIDAQLRHEERWREELATATTQQRALGRDERRLTELRVQDQSDSQRLGQLQARSKILKDQGDQINEKLSLLQHSGDTACPLCRSEIGDHGIAEIEQNYIAERLQLRDEYKESNVEAKALQVEIDGRRREISGLERKLSDLPVLAGKVARLENDLRDVEEMRARRAEAQTTFLDLDSRIANEDFAHAERATLATIERDINTLGLDQAMLDTQRRAISAKINQRERTLSERGKVEAQMTMLAEQLRVISASEQQLSQTREALLALQVRIDSEDFAHADHARIAELTSQMNNLGYGRNAHEQARILVQQLQPWADQGYQLRSALAHLVTNERQLTRLTEMIMRTESELVSIQATLGELQVEVAQLASAIGAVEEAQRVANEQRGRLAVAQKDLGAAQQNLHQVEEVAQQLHAKHIEYDALNEEREVYTELARAFGKKGIQAMLIETAIPELERESNELLGRMTDNQMHLRFETQRETRKGDTSETLEIHIADEQGTRRYDLYSGGEAFRINFAIRIALSKMLARRAGASLQTLIIDEGFGSQDGRGRERLVEAINHIQHDFNRILVITHIQELKDLFPVHIEITKTDIGSSWMIN